MIVTIACPISMTHDGINPDSAPIWVDAAGNQYRVASGIIDGCEATSHQTATPDAITVIFGVTGLAALATMGLKPVEDAGNGEVTSVDPV
jgi:hypothetical protein